MHVEHEAAEGRPQVVGQVLIRHATQDEVHVQLPRDLVDGQVLPVQTHSSKEVQLIAGGEESQNAHVSTSLTMNEWQAHTGQDRWPQLSQQ